MNSMEEDFRQMNSDGYDEQYQQCFHGNSKIINGVASEFEMPKSQPLNLGDKRPMLSKNVQKGNGDRICDTCNKEDVCMYKGELAQAYCDITQISDRVNVFIDTDIRCKKWSGKVSNYRSV